MNARRNKFVLEYLIDKNATQAAIRAGYSAKTAYSQGQRLLRFVEVRDAIAKALEQQAKRTQITADYVLTTIRDTVERCAKETPVLDREGNETGEYKFESFAVLKGCELLGKHLRLFADKIEIDQQIDSEIERRLALLANRSEEEASGQAGAETEPVN